MQQAQRQSIRELAGALRDCFPGQIPEEIAINLGGSVVTADRIEADALAKVTAAGDSFEITVLADESQVIERQLSIAHELGHLFLHMGFQTDAWQQVPEYTDAAMYRAGYSHEEREAYEFAYALLMPEDEFRKAVDTLQADDSTIDVQQLAAKFNVPSDAALQYGRTMGILEWS